MLNCLIFYTYEYLKLHAQLSCAKKKFYNLGTRIAAVRIIKYKEDTSHAARLISKGCLSIL